MCVCVCVCECSKLHLCTTEKLGQRLVLLHGYTLTLNANSISSVVSIVMSSSNENTAEV